ncbi:uncharacterized protein LOC106759214 isoform X2 [Vigna radiata var. radiata]|uniref:Uncharacterized protein LOC106759214 isoform X2 n=1 Tax=Vigna radiata var. radiata TaxID=3916 RepID=A0A3Q0EZ10_VIGRR|nr:uncharacterized protein LOC106759214 isoform X2 [Vigna radiata var. radiata]
MEVVVSTTTESVLQIATRVMKQQLSYFFNYNDKLDEVKCYIEMLDNTRKRIQHQVNNAEMNAEEIEDDVQHCLKLLDEKIKTYENFIHDEHHSKTRCSIGFFPNNLQLRYRLGRKATKMVEEMKAGELWNKRFDEVSYRVLPSIDVALTNTIYENFASRTKTMDMVMQALEDCTVNMIGIYGVGGVGKTTLVKEVAKIAQEKKLFNVVVMANIARIPNIIKIQGQIAEMLGMRLEEESEIVRADRIRKRLTKTKENTLIILDDLWDGLDLNRLGIPCSDEDDGSQHDVNDIPNSSYDKMEKEELSSDLIEEKLSDNQKRCKILLTSRRKQVLCNKMDVQEKSTFSVGVLPENEAKTLLKKVAGIHDQNLVYDEKALEIARMCDGLPIALVSIGKTLKNKSSFVWVDVYQQMKKQSFVDGKEPIEFSIKLSYDHLENEQLKCIFLHCARMGNDALVMDVVKFCIGLGLLQGVHTIREARNKVTMLIEELKESSLVLESYSSYCFNMHDIVRDVALLISSKEKHIFFMKNGILDEWPHKDQLERYTAIVLQYCYINDDLPESIYCPRLEVLHIDNKDHFLKIPDDFFRGMIELRVLILNGLSFPCLPSSIMCLTKLRMLTLKKCTIGQNLSIIGKLKKLRILNLSGSNIECFPFEFGQLVKLQLLDLSNCSKLKVIPSNVISKMNSLEEFYMQDSLIQWETEENIQSQNGSLCELRHLNQLRNLDIHIQNVVHVPRNFFLDELDSYKIIIGESKMLTEGDFKIPNKYEMVKLLALNLKEGIAIHTETWIKMLLKDVEYLWLGELIDVHDVFYELNVEGFQKLKHLSIVNNIGLQYIINSVERFHPLLAFPKLESLYLYKLYNLKKLCNNQLLEASFYRLKTIKIKSCDKLESLFPFSMVKHLTMLETIEVCDCDSLMDMVSVGTQTHTNNGDNIEFPQLRLLTLKSLHVFTCLYTNDKIPCAQPFEDKGQSISKDIITGVYQDGTNSCLSLFNEKVIYNLEHMAMSFREVEWLQNYIVNVHRMLNLQSIALHGLKNAEILFWFLHRIPNLKRLTVGLCHLRRIWGPATHISQEKIGVVMQLKELVLKSMWSLEEIGFEHEVLLQRVQRLIILRCTKLKNLASSTVSFNRLTYLEVANCMMKNLMTYSTAKTLVQLTTMKVSSCPMIAVIVAKNEGENVQEIEFKQLRSLELVSLPNLTSFLSVDKCVLKFSLLENLVVSECPQMTKFSEVLSTPNLQKVHAVTGEKDKWYWEGDLNATLQKHFPHQVFFKYSKHMKLKDYPEMKEVRYGKPVFSDNFFGSLKKLEFDVASKRDIVIPSHVLPYLKNLEELKVERCKPAEVIFDLYESETKTIVFQLKKLTLKDLSNLKCVWNKNPKGIINFPNLEEVFIYECETLATLFPLTLAKNLGNLKTLTIHKCFKLIEIVEKKEETERGTIETFEFPRLLKLFLWNLPQLNCFYSGQHHLKCPMLERLHVAYCHKVKLFKSGFQHSPLQHPMFSIEEVVPKLKELMLSEKNIILLNDRHSPQDLLHKINYLDISFEDHDSMKNTLPFDFLHKVPNLENLVVRGYCGLKELFPSQKLDGHDGMLPELNKLSLQMVFELESIGLDHPWVKPYTEKLKVLAVGKCHRLERLVSCATSFIDLKQLVVKDCKRMKNLFTFPTAKSLMNLETLVIENCASIKEIIEKEDEDVNDEILLGRLSNLSLHSLPRLVSFYSGNATLNFSSLQQVKLFNCPSMKTFCETNINAPMLYGIKSSTDDFNLDLFHDLNTTIESFFYEKDFFEYSKHTILLDYFEMRGIGSVKQASQGKSFGNIKKLEFDGKSTGDTVIPSNVLSHLKSLEELNVHNSDEVQVIFGMNDSHTKTKETVFHLKILTLKDLSNLKCIVSKNPQESVSFPNLQKLFVDSCGSLVTLIARNLGKLNTHEMQRYDKLVEIVGKEDAIENRTTEVLMFEFPCLSLLTLYNLTNLSCFYPEKHHLECPKLEIMHVAYCPKLKLFTSKIHDSHKEAITEAPISCLQQPLFIVEKVVPKLKGLTLNEKNMMLFSDARMPQDYLSKLSLLRLCFEDDKNEKGTLPFDFLHRVPNLEHFRVQRCFGTKEIFSSKKLKVHDGIPATLNALTLFELNELESIGFEHPWVKPFSEKLQTLRVISCPWLEKLGRGALSFINLKELYVMDCGRIEYLFTFSTAKSLVLLETLIVRNCESIKEIAMKEDEDDCDEIIFERLTTLTLNSLPRLQSFLAGNAIMQFSCLKNAYVINCPNMKTFSDGVLTAPRFLGIKTSYQDSDLFFHDDLNTSFQRLFQTQVEKSACDTEHLKFGDHSHLQEIWLGVAPISTNNSFNNLKSLTVVECESFPNVIPFHLLPFLCNLKEIEVSNCQSVKAIFDVNGEGADMKPISLPLKKLVLNQLPNLEHIWNLNPDEILSLQDLQQVSISNCQTLKSLFPTSVANHLVKLHVRACATLVEIFAEADEAINGETKQFNFHCLTSLTLWELPELKYLYPGKHTLEWPMLTQLDIYHCDQLKLFKTEHHSDEFAHTKDQLGISIHQQAAFSVEKVFPKLVQLSLKKEDAVAISQAQLQVMPSIEHQEITWKDTMIGQGQFGANVAHLLQNLKLLKLMCYHEDDNSNIFSSGLLEEIPNIENLEVVCSSFTEIFCSQGPATDCSKVLSKLKRLHLKNLSQLNAIGLEHSWVEPLLKTLETLEVFSCPTMKILVPSTLSFSNLTSLNVGECHGLIYVFTSSTAKRLGQLKNISIRDCQAIQEIVSKEEDHESEDEDEEITFDQLSLLSLESLPNIIGIYSGTFKLKFPCLDQVTLKECPQMKYSYVPDLHEFKPQEQT